MSLKDKIKQFPEENPDFILEIKGEFLVATDVDCSSLPSFQRNIINSYDQEILLNLSDKLQTYLNDKYENGYKSLAKQYEIANINGNEKYRRIFYYSQIAEKDLKPKKIDNDSSSVSTVLQKSVASLDFTPTEKDKNTIITKTISNDLLKKNSYTKKFKEWYICSFEEVQGESPFKTALNIVLNLLSKKGSWTLKDSNIKKSSKQNFQFVPINISSLSGQGNEKEPFIAANQLVLLSELEDNIISLYQKKSLSQTKPEIVFEENTFFSTGLSVFYKFYKDPISSKNSYLVGFPKTYIEQFPDLALSIDYEEIEISEEIYFDNFQDIKTNTEALKNIINKKKKSLENDSLYIKNYDIDYFISKIDEFVGELNNKIQEQKFDVNKKINLFFQKKPCQQIPLEPNDPEKNSINQSEYKKCINEFVDGQTNLYLWTTQVNKNYDLKNVSSISIDGNLAAYLLANCKNIVKASDSYTAKNFFSKLIYLKTQFEKEETLNLSTFNTAVQISFQNSFINNAANIIKYSKIRQNIEKENYKNKTVSQNIKDALADINSIKALYEAILYRYDLKDVADELLQCILSENPNLNDQILIAEQFIQNLIKSLNVNDPNIIKLANCFNIKIPTSLGQIKLDDLPPAGDFTINKEELKSSISNLFSTAVQKVSDLDFLIPTIAKCYNEFGDEQVKILINTYFESEAARKALKQQYDQLVLEAKLYKPAPGVKDSLQKQSSEKKTFLKKALRNAWVLLQKQAEQEAEKLVIEATVEFIKSLLKDLNDCKPSNSKNTSTNQTGNPGDLRLYGNPKLLDQKINNLLQELSLTLNPEKLCSLFYGSADDELYETILGLIKQKISDLYTQPQVIKINNNVFFSQPLSSIQAVRKFFISLSTANPEITTNKCDKYFEDLSNALLPLDDEKKCIDFTEEYVNKKKQQLIDKGYTEEQANEIINNQKKIQSQKYINLENTVKNGVYNEITSTVEESEYPVSSIVKEKVQKQLEILTTSCSQFIDSYKDQVLQLSGSSLDKYKISLQNNQNLYNYNNNTLKIKNGTIIFKQTGKISPWTSITPIYQYSSETPYKISIKSENYDSLQSAASADIFLSLKNVLKMMWSSTNTSFSEFNDLEDEFWIKNCLNNSAVEYTERILEIFQDDFTSIKQENFDKEKILTNIEELIYFEDK